MSSSKEKVIFIHGLGQTPASWNKTVSALSEHIAPDCISLFSMGKNKEMTYNNLYSTFEDYCEKENKPLNLCGISLGAVLGLNYAINHPQKLQSLVLIAPQYKMPAMLLKLQNMIFFFTPEAQFSRLGMSKKSIIHLTSSMLNLEIEEGFKNISCTTAVIYGEKDTANKKAAIVLSENISTSILCVIKGTGHEVNTKAPDQLAEILNSFYSSSDIFHYSD